MNHFWICKSEGRERKDQLKKVEQRWLVHMRRGRNTRDRYKRQESKEDNYTNSFQHIIWTVYLILQVEVCTSPNKKPSDNCMTPFSSKVECSLAILQSFCRDSIINQLKSSKHTFIWELTLTSVSISCCTASASPDLAALWSCVCPSYNAA